MKNINIPEPCSEDWSKMSPTQQGAFCQKCAIDVYDFTNKSGDEIRDILTLNIGGRVCGKIEPSQLEELNDEFHAWRMKDTQSFNKAWVFTLLVVFGMTLFSCEEDEEPVVQKLQKTAQAFLSDSQGSNDVSENTVVIGDSNNNDQVTTTGEFHIPKSKTVSENHEIRETIGKIKAISDVQEPISPQAIKGNVRYVEHILGGMSWTPAYTDSITESIDPACEVQMSGLVYPNPAKNSTTLKVIMPNKSKAEIQLFSINGQSIRSIHAGRIQKGESEFPIDLTGLETGMYIVVIVSGDKKETIKFSKI